MTTVAVLSILAVLLFIVAGALYLAQKAIPAALTNFGLAFLAWVLLL